MGALTYEPDMHFQTETSLSDLDIISDECRQVLQSDDSADVSALDDLFAMGGSSGEHVPKFLPKWTEMIGS